MTDLVYTIARRVLAEGHRVTMMEHVELDWPTWDGYPRYVALQDLLKRDYPQNYLLLGALNCNLTHLRSGRLDRYRAEHEFTHVIFTGRNAPHMLTVKDRILAVDHYSLCLSTAIESGVRQVVPPHFTLLVDDASVLPLEVSDDCENTTPLHFHDILTTELCMVALLYNGLHSLRVAVMQLPTYSEDILSSPLVREELSVAVAEVSFAQAMCRHLTYDLVVSRLVEVTTLIQSGRLVLIASDIGIDSTQAKRDSLLTTYFTSKKDPQRRANSLKVDNIDYIEDWHDSAVHLGIHGAIFHDGLTEDFQSLVNQSLFTFHRVSLGRRSTNDERYYHYLDYLERHPEIEYALMTDVSDIVFPRDPFKAMRVIDEGGERLYVGEDDNLRWPLVGESGWVMNIVKRCYGQNSDTRSGDLKSLSRHSILLNAGVVGGRRHVVLRFLRQLTAVLRIASGGINCNMGSVNYIAHKYFDDKLYSGYPLTSLFKRYNRLFDGYVIHK